MLIVLCNLLWCGVCWCRSCFRGADGHEQELQYTVLPEDPDDDKSWVDKYSEPAPVLRDTQLKLRPQAPVKLRVGDGDRKDDIGEELTGLEDDGEDERALEPNVREMLTEYRMREALSQLDRTARGLALQLGLEMDSDGDDDMIDGVDAQHDGMNANNV